MKLFNPPPSRLGDLEAAVMDHLWSGGDGEVKAVHRVLGKARGITLNTVQSTLKRLFDKDLLARDKVSHAHIYRVRVTREEFHYALLGDLVGDLMAGHSEMVVSSFVSLTERAGLDQLARLEAMVSARRRALAEATEAFPDAADREDAR